MNSRWCRSFCAGAALLSVVAVATFAAQSAAAHAQGASLARTHKPGGTTGARSKKAPATAPAPAAANQPKPLPPRPPFTAAEDAAASIPGMPDARFSADSTDDFVKALPEKPGPWLALSSGGSDGAFGAGLLNGLSASGKRPDYAVVTGVSTGALIAPFAFAGPRYDDALRDAFTKITSADIFEIGATPESFLDTWPLKDLIAKQVTPALIADIAAQYRAGRRLLHHHDRSRCRTVHGLEHGRHRGSRRRASDQAVPHRPVGIEQYPRCISAGSHRRRSNGKHFSEMHVDGGVGGQFFVAPAALMAATSDYRLPATGLYVLVNSGPAAGLSGGGAFDGADPRAVGRNGRESRYASDARPRVSGRQAQRRRF